MAYKKTYKAIIENVEEVEPILLIEDTLSGEANPYGFSLAEVDNGDGTLTATIAWTTALPGSATATNIGYSSDGGATWTNSAGGTSSPRAVTIPTGNYIYRLVVNYADSSLDETYLMDEIDGEPEEITLADRGLRLRCNNGSENIVQSITALELLIRLKVNSNINLNTFLQGTYSARRFKTTLFIYEKPIFKGFLNIADSEEPFMPYPNEIELSATDMLGNLKNKELLGFDGEELWGLYTVGELVAMCLHHTGLSLPINVAMNIRLEDYVLADADGHFFTTEKLDVRTFEGTEMGKRINCYEALQQIFKNKMELGQRWGEWFIKSIDEYDTHADYVAVFSAAGVFQEMKAATLYEKEIGASLPMHWISERQMVAFSEPVKSTRENHNYEAPKEVFRNQDFRLGDERASGSGYKEYNLDHWTRVRVNSTTGAESSSYGAFDAYIRRNFRSNDNAEFERYVVMTNTNVGGTWDWIKSGGQRMNEKDRVSLSYNWRISAKTLGADEVTFRTLLLKFVGDSGLSYIYAFGIVDGSLVPRRGWLETSTHVAVIWTTANIEYVSDAKDDSKWESFSYDVEEGLPEDGTLYMYLGAFDSNFLVDWDIHYSNVKVTYKPYINGTYEYYAGQFHQAEQSGENNEAWGGEVNMTDGPKNLLKGALHHMDGSDLVLSNAFYNAAKNPGGPPDASYVKPYGWHQMQSTHNLQRQLRRKMRGLVQGIQTDIEDAEERNDVATIFHTYYLRDTDPHVNNRKFKLMSYDMDLHRCEMTAVFREVYDTANPKVYDDAYTFNYIKT